MELDRQSRTPDLVQQRVEPVETWLGDELDFVAVAPHGGEEAAHLGERRPAGALDAPERVAILGQLVGQVCLTAPTWSTMTLTACATTSWSSRAMRARSSATATRAADSRSRSA